MPGISSLLVKILDVANANHEVASVGDLTPAPRSDVGIISRDRDGSSEGLGRHIRAAERVTEVVEMKAADI